jgi:pantetheine-phosphate adenylyltransferase
MERIAIYPGTFDPLTNGHVNIIERSLRIFDKVIVGVHDNSNKDPMFDADQRVTFVQEAFPQDSVEVDSFDDLLVNYAKSRDVSVIVRGLRAVSDFEYELQMANMNRKLDDSIETIFMMTEESDFYVSSTLVREVASFGGDIEGIVPPHVVDALRERFED